MRLGDDEIIYITCLNRRIHFSIEDTPVKTYSSIIGEESVEIGRSASPKHNKRNGR